MAYQQSAVKGAIVLVVLAAATVQLTPPRIQQNVMTCAMPANLSDWQSMRTT